MHIPSIASQVFNPLNAVQGGQTPRAHYEPLDQSAQSGSSTNTSQASSLGFASSNLQSSLNIRSLLASELGTLGSSLQAGNVAAARQAYSALSQALNNTLPSVGS